MKINKIFLCLSVIGILAACSSSSSSSINNVSSENIGVSQGSLTVSSENSSDKNSSEKIESSSSKNESSSISSSSNSSSSKSSSSLNSSSSKNSSNSSANSSVSTQEGFVKTITAGGSYTLTGQINGSILVQAPDTDDVEIILSNATITSSFNSPIYCLSGNELKIKLDAGTNNYIKDLRNAINPDQEDETQGKGAIYSKCDLKITGKGSLTIEANYNNGIHSTDDLKLKNTVDNNSKITITSYNHALKGNDSIEIESGKLILNSKCGGGMKTENTDISSKGNQRGDILISGGDIEINSCEDAIESAHDLDISGSPTIKILTSTYSSYTVGSISGGNDANTAKMYLRTSNNTYNYSVSFKDSNGNTTWVDANYSTSKTGGRGTTYYFYELNKPSNAVSMKVFIYNKTTSPRNENNALGSTPNYININSNYDTAVISGTSSLSCSQWTNFNSTSGGQGGGGWGGPGGSQGNTNKADYSAKGLKADNVINISGGNIDIKAYDDAIHASRGEVFENGKTGLGNVNISGGNLTLYATDDGIHADYTNTISGGNIDITNSYEGVEGNFVNITGGYTKIYSTDDGLNAANKSGESPSITVSGGVLDITVYGGDVDGIDSNNTYTQTGGVVITKGGTGGMSTGLDTDGTARVNGGSLIVFGKPEKTPTLGAGVSSYTLSGSYSIGTYLLSNTTNSYTVTTKYSYSIIYIYSNEANRYTVTKK